MSTIDNLQTAFAGESQARNKYLAFAQKADEEGHKGAARLFRAAAQAEFVHAQSQLRVLGLVKSTAQNLQAAIAGETHEFTEMYPSFIAEARADGSSPAALRALELPNQAEKVHAQLYSAALAGLESGDLVSREETPYFVCGVCGHIEKGSAPDRCPICGAPAARFSDVG